MSSNRPALPPEKLRSNSYPTEEQIRFLGKEMIVARVSEPTRLLMARLAVLQPKIRLAVNLKTLIGLMLVSPVYNILTEGLTEQEHAALVDLDLHALSIDARETAHGLLNIHERWYLAKDLRRLFNHVEISRGGYLVPEEQA